ncbi:Universal stress protein family protein [Marinobacter persicus]|uniref:Universal stress protein family protein n=1 Tax=Marinobacter persicus TaxID=930118 RepID=A0A1I3WN02_9GAMM|nr:universal stress protein [Marinobacter persicus]SFK08257.1 Universal stress protein family protein [Marinobacter persicus]
MTDSTLESVGGRPAGGRVLVLLDGSRVSLSALEAAASIAEHTGAEVHGVFVEEQDLLRSAGYGFAREVGAFSGLSRPLDVVALEQRMQRLAEQTRRTLAGVVGRYGGRYRLNISRGRVVEEVLALAGPEDLLVLGRARWATVPGPLLGSTVRGLVQRSPGRLLLWSQQRAPTRGRIVVFLNDHEQANRRAVSAAAEAAAYSRQPVALLLAEGASVTGQQLSELKQLTGLPESEVQVLTLPASDPVTIARLLRRQQAAQLVLSRECSLFQEPGAEALLSALHLPVTITP